MVYMYNLFQKKTFEKSKKESLPSLAFLPKISWVRWTNSQGSILDVQ